MDIDEALTWAASRKNGILITIRQDGRAQSSDIVYAVDGGDVIISVTDDRAKTVNMRRDPRVVLHLTDPASWSYLSLDGTVALSDVTSSADDAANDALVEYYEAVNGSPHPNWDEYRQAMVDQGRLIARFTPTSAVGQVH
jgi:PPOX class probable F420-dependent enzyme